MSSFQTRTSLLSEVSIFMNTPFFLKSQAFFEEPEMLAKVCNPRTGLGPRPAYPMPEFTRQQRIADYKRKIAIERPIDPDHATTIDLTRYDDIPEPVS